MNSNGTGTATSTPASSADDDDLVNPNWNQQLSPLRPPEEEGRSSGTAPTRKRDGDAKSQRDDKRRGGDRAHPRDEKHQQPPSAVRDKQDHHSAKKRQHTNDDRRGGTKQDGAQQALKDDKGAARPEVPDEGGNSDGALPAMPIDSLEPIQYHPGSRPNVEDGMRKGTVIVGELRILKWSTGIAFVKCPGLGVDVEIHGQDARSQALHGDIVAVELSPEDTWYTMPKDTDAKEPAATGTGEDGVGSGGDPRPAVTPTTAAAADDTAEDDRIAPLIHARRTNPDAAPATLPDGRVIVNLVDESALLVGRPEPTLAPAAAIYRALGLEPPRDRVPAGKKPRGVVLCVLERRYKTLHPCRIVEDRNNYSATSPQVQPNRFYKFRSYDDKYPYLAVFGRDIPRALHEKLAEVLPLVRILRKHDTNEPEEFLDKRFPKGEVLFSLGASGTTEAETRAIAAMNGIRDVEFSEEVEACVVREFRVPSLEELQASGRRDLRETEFVCTIDPATARDLDDALSITKTANGFRVGVHIADVSHFVPVGSALDDEARARATSTYFVERVVPMLPHRLSEDYCSLNAGEDKFAFSCLFQMDRHGNVVSEWFGQSVIRNRCRMAYEDAQLIIDGDSSGASLTIHPSELAAEHTTREALVTRVVESVQLLFGLAKTMREARFEQGALSLNKNKLKFQFDDMNSRLAPKGFGLEISKEANWMVEQFMLLANIRVAQKIVQYLPESSLLRHHPAPNRRKLRLFAEAASKHGYKVDIGGKTGKSLNDSLQRYAKDPNSDALRLMATYNMMLAKYVCSGEDEVDLGHFALATPFYTHFTSPIRRYADLIVHRELVLALEIEAAAKEDRVRKEDASDLVDVSLLPHSHYYLTRNDCEEIATQCNDKKESSRRCSEASLKLFLCLYLDAVRLRARVDPTVNAVQRAEVTVVRVKDSSFTVYANDVASDCEIFFNARTQRWVEECQFVADEKTFVINWGRNPRSSSGGGEDVLESVGLFSRFVAALKVSREQGLVKLDMIVEPPWERGEGSATVLKAIPTQLS